MDTDQDVSPDLDDDPCVICLDGTVYDDNEIIFCEKCGIAVHQSCYGVSVIPEDAWYCDVCRAGLDPEQTDCRLCPNRGGAYKRTEVKDTWAHSLCATWVPDAFIDSSGKQIVYNCSVVNKSRFKLKCAVCTKIGGACIQCAFGRCCVPAHPWCAIRPQSGFTHRIVKSVDNPGSYDWDIFCPQHADAVTDPVKPKVRAKRVPAPDHEEAEAVEEPPKSSTSKSKVSTPSATPRQGRGRPKGATSASSGSKSRSRMQAAGEESDCGAPSGSEGDGEHEGGGFPGRIGSNGHSAIDKDRSRSTPSSANIYTVSEWPGQGVGEPLDLQHFWNVTSMLYPEDFSNSALKSVLEPILNIVNESSNVLDVPKRGDMAQTMQQLSAGNEDLFDPSLGTEKERASAADEHRIDQLMWSIANVIGALKSSVGTSGLCIQETVTGSDIQTGQTDGNDDEQLFIGEQTEALKVNPASFDLQPLEYFKINSGDATSTLAKRDAKYPLSVVFEREDASRVGCEYSICLPSNGAACSCCKVHVVINSNSQEDDDKYIMNSFSTWKNSPDACIIPGRPRDPAMVAGQELVVGVGLKETTDIPPSLRIPLADGSAILSRDDEDELTLVLRRELKAYKLLLDTITSSVKSIYENPEFKALVGKRYGESQEAARLQRKYFEQQVWKNVARSFSCGVKDQRTDFNRPVLDVVPASWTIKVGDREAIIKAAESNPEEDTEEHEDVVCMVCFDGTSTDSNRILFCDGCNSAMHQSCYGIAEIPEGDFLCDRCKALRSIIEEDEGILEHKRVKDILTCCLCSAYHGAMKPTTDGRWVHLTCAIWCGDLATIVDAQHMHPVDISRVPLITPAAFNNNSVRRSLSRMRFSDEHEQDAVQSVENSVTETVAPKKCLYCQKTVGYITTCSANGCEDISCTVHFHPLCMWFAGGFVSCKITDDTFMALDRGDRRYPAGLQFDFYCEAHAGIEGNEVKPELRPLQAKIRHKYRILESDLDHVPGSKRRKHKQRTESTQQVRSGAPLVKELPPDVYDETLCACCLKPTKELLVPETLGKTDPFAQVVACDSCGICVHRRCVRNAAVSSFSNIASSTPSAIADRTPLGDTDKPIGAASSSSSVMESAADAVVSVEHVHQSESNKSDATNSDIKSEVNTIPGAVSWTCDACLSGEFIGADATPTCGLCPRRGGLFLRTPYGRWVHSFCADFLCTVTFQESKSIGGCPNSLVSMRNIPGSKKQTCMICNRKAGVCMTCSDPECPVLVHPICAEHTDNFYVRVRQGNKELYCPNHVPEYAVRLVSGSGKSHIVDILEVRNLRISLDRARVILDLILKRERIKKNLIKTQGESFETKLQKLCRRLRSKLLSKPTPSAAEGSESAVPGSADGLGEHGAAEGHMEVATEPTELPSSASNEVVIPDSLKELCGYAHEGGGQSLSDDEEEDKDDDYAHIIADDTEYIAPAGQPKRGRKPKGRGDQSEGFDAHADFGKGRKSKGIDRDDPSYVPFLRRSVKFDDDGEPVDISMEWTKKAVPSDDGILSISDPTLMLDLPKVLVVQYCGQDVYKGEVLEAGSLEKFMEIQKQAQLETVERTRAAIGMFSNQDEADTFVESLGTYIDGCMELPVEKLRNAYEKNGVIKLKPPKKVVAPPVEEEVEVVVEAIVPEPSSRRRKSLVAEEEAPPAEPTTSSRRRRSDESSDLIPSVALSHPKRSRSESTTLHGIPASRDIAMNASTALEHLKLLTTGGWGESLCRRGFEGVFSDVLQHAGKSQNDDDWQFSSDISDVSFVTMERKCNYVMQRLDAYTVKKGVEAVISSNDFVQTLTKPSTKSSTSSKKKRGSSSSIQATNSYDEEEQRDLVEDFASFPYEDSAEIRQELALNAPPPSFEALRDRLKAHELRSFADFARRFYFMLNCFRRVCPRDSKIWWDSAVLAAVFEMAKEECDIAGNVASKLEKSVSDFTIVSKPSAKSAGCNLKCCGCSQSYESMSWPVASLCKECISFEGNVMPTKQSNRKAVTADWGWFCPHCIKKRGADLVSLEIKVWWLQDAVYYEGRVDAYDTFSGTHRIQYVDGEWEFVDLRFEPYIVHATEFQGKQKRSMGGTCEPSNAKKVRIDLSVDASPIANRSTSTGASSTGRSSRSSDPAAASSSLTSPSRASLVRLSGSSLEGERTKATENKGTLLQFFGEPKKARSSASK